MGNVKERLKHQPLRHLERSVAIQSAWIATSLRSSQ